MISSHGTAPVVRRGDFRSGGGVDCRRAGLSHLLEDIWTFFLNESNQKAVASVLAVLAAIGAVFLYLTGRLGKLVEYFSGKKENAAAKLTNTGVSQSGPGIGQISGGTVTVNANLNRPGYTGE
ncbi:MAG: hypothetical protein ACE5FS_16460 [Paracoccaceae bacterium]